MLVFWPNCARRVAASQEREILKKFKLSFFLMRKWYASFFLQYIYACNIFELIYICFICQFRKLKYKPSYLRYKLWPKAARLKLKFRISASRLYDMVSQQPRPKYPGWPAPKMHFFDANNEFRQFKWHTYFSSSLPTRPPFPSSPPSNKEQTW